jgi:hypothetical protein
MGNRRPGLQRSPPEQVAGLGTWVAGGVASSRQCRRHDGAADGGGSADALGYAVAGSAPCSQVGSLNMLSGRGVYGNTATLAWVSRHQVLDSASSRRFDRARLR